ncbi:MAG: YkgJ family cysteine cluster protein [Bacillota bacterium]
MTRLPLDYPGMFSAWRAMAEALHHPESPYTARISEEVWKNKLSLISNIIGHSQEMTGCRRCGECCLDFPFACRAVEFLHLLPYMAQVWPPGMQEHFFESKLGVLTPEGKNLCPFFEQGNCSVYPVRPLLCRRSVCGEHICNHQSVNFDNPGHWCNDPQVIRQLTIKNILYYDIQKTPPEEMGWALNASRGHGPGNRIVIAPFEMWLLLLFNDSSWRMLLNIPGYQPLIKTVIGDY